MSEPPEKGPLVPDNSPTPPHAKRDAASAWAQDAYAPLVTEGPIVDALRAKLAAIAVELGHPPEVEQMLEVSGPGFFRTLLDRGVTIVRIVSPPFTAKGDERRLGVAVAEVQIDGEVVPLTDLRLQQGFHDVENNGTPLRWTNGNAYIVLDPTPFGRVLRLKVIAGRPAQE